MGFSIWHRSREGSAWVLIAIKNTREDALAVLEYQRTAYRSGMLRLVDPAGLVLRRESCRRVAVPA